ncbi:sugar diacid recognition domain-containing protein [Neobacillus sp. DY30]|uniref:CdaR family transcriptional regulator n=1 Tax=Neobacillus sp. DY30 TaxID=3047871 RepID=UPI0024C04F14|nr:sugar diacid recognition domain-containing protein [Neobacillus sp. DY30]WHX98630.1 sugar diacid recognition domain-containing protein [Neobacillus sp. DY30]
MKILEHIAQEIVEKTSEILDFPISITDNEGYIIGSTDKDRIGLFHQPSLEVIKKNVMVDCKSELEKKILPGVSAPIKFNNKVIGVLGIVGAPREVEKYVQLVKNQVEMMCQEAFRNEMVELKEKMVEMFVHQIIQYKEKGSEKTDYIHQYAKLLEFDLHKDRACLLITINCPSEIKSANKEREEILGSFQYFQKEVLSFLNLIFHENKDDIVSLIDFEKYIVIKSLPYQKSYLSLLESLEEKLKKINSFLETKYHVSASISAGDISNSLQGISESYQNAVKAMNIGIKSNQESKIFVYNERETLLWMLPKELVPDYRNKLLKLVTPLIEHDSYEVLSSTFVGFCKYNMNLSEASRNLFIHRNTIIYRLEKISEITSLSTSSFEHCMLLYTAIQCYEETKQKSGV